MYREPVKEDPFTNEELRRSFRGSLDGMISASIGIECLLTAYPGETPLPELWEDRNLLDYLSWMENTLKQFAEECTWAGQILLRRFAQERNLPPWQ